MLVATCRCGNLRAECAEEPLRVSVCHCLECQRRTGSAFSAQTRFPTGSVKIEGEYAEWTFAWRPDGCRRLGADLDRAERALVLIGRGTD